MRLLLLVLLFFHLASTATRGRRRKSEFNSRSARPYPGGGGDEWGGRVGGGPDEDPSPIRGPDYGSMGNGWRERPVSAARPRGRARRPSGLDSEEFGSILPPANNGAGGVLSGSAPLSSSALFPFSAIVAKSNLEQQQNGGAFAVDPTCNSSELREIIVQGISDTPSDSKHRINAAITRNMDGSFGIVCADCAFSYLAHTIQYCHYTRNNITCFVYRDG